MDTSSDSERRTTRYRLAAVWFADIVGYSDLAAWDEPQALSRVSAFQDAVREVVTAQEGRVVKFLGDGALCEFPHTIAAVESALSLSSAFRSRSGAPDSEVRVGIAVGDVASSADGDLYGGGVNVAARLQSEAAPGQVVATEEVWSQVRRHPTYAAVDLGERRLKGVGEVHLYALRLRGEPARAPVIPSPGHRRRNLAYLGIGAIVALAGTGIATWVQSRDGEEEKAESPPRSNAVLATPDTVKVMIIDSFPGPGGFPPPPATTGPPDTTRAATERPFDGQLDVSNLKRAINRRIEEGFRAAEEDIRATDEEIRANEEERRANQEENETERDPRRRERRTGNP